MSEYYKLADNPTFWFVENGKRTIVHHIEEHGILPVIVVTPEELDAIPFAWESDEEE
jgi:hypothetical protein